MAREPSAKARRPDTGAPAPPPGPEVICEPGRHVGCLHARMAAKRGK